MFWKKLPTWLKTGIFLSTIALALFLLGGIISANANGGKCVTPPCSAGSGACTRTLEGCFGFSNALQDFWAFPTTTAYYSIIAVHDQLLNSGTAIDVNPLLNVLPSLAEPYGYAFANLILYFVLGAVIGLIVQKCAEKYKAKKK